MLFQHAWQALQDQKAQKFRADINKLVMKLSDILSADFGHSKEGMSADRLQASIGSVHRDAFDFAAMSRMLTAASVNVPMPESRRQRVRGLLSVLRSQRFFPPATESDKWIGVAEPYSFVFESCSDAVAAYRERLPKLTELAKAIAIAKLETDGEYSEARHDAFFAEFGDNGLDPDDIAAFPDYLICLRAADLQAAESDLILQAFVAGMPAKVVVQTDDLLEQSPIGDDYLIAGLRGRQLTSAAIGFGAYYVLQSSSSSLFHLREQVRRGLAYRGPALFSVFSGANEIRHAALPDGRRCRGIPGFPSLHLRSVGRMRTGHRGSRFTPIRNSISIGRCSASTMRMRNSSSYRKRLPSRLSTSPPATRVAPSIWPRCRGKNGPPICCRYPNFWSPIQRVYPKRCRAS